MSLIEGEFLRGAGPVAVLKLLERGEMYGYEIVEALEKRTDGVLAMGQSTLYPMLYNLEAKGFVGQGKENFEYRNVMKPKCFYSYNSFKVVEYIFRQNYP